jgi:cell division septation protein DedD
MKNREFREIQVSSTQLAIIFLGILVIGVVIFLLGVSVGKKQAQVSESTNIIAQQEPEKIKEKITTLPQRKPEEESTREPAAKQSAADTSPANKKTVPEKTEAVPPATKPKAPVESVQQSPAEQKNLYYVQVAALTERAAAQSTARKFRGMGYTVVVLDPQPTDRTPVYRVRVGGFLTREQADDVRSQLSAAAGGKTDYFIVRD